MKHADPQSVARAIETLADSVQDNQAAHKTIMSMKPMASRDVEDGPIAGRPSDVDDTLRPFGDMAPPARPPICLPTFQPPVDGGSSQVWPSSGRSASSTIRFFSRSPLPARLLELWSRPRPAEQLWKPIPRASRASLLICVHSTTDPQVVSQLPHSCSAKIQTQRGRVSSILVRLQPT